MEILNNLIEKLKSLIAVLNDKGVPLPMVRDPKTGEGSVTLTMTFISFNTALLGQIGKIGNLLGNVDLTQANYLFLMCLGAYLGRRMQGSGDKKSVDMSTPDEKSEETK